MEKNLGHATAYGYAKSKGYSGTEEEFAQLMADYASVGQSAAQSAEQAAASATSASGSAATASQSAITAETASESARASATASAESASQASQSAESASKSASASAGNANFAASKALDASNSASEASQSASTATQAKTDAITAKTDAETARDSAAQSAEQAAASAESIDPDEFDRKIYAAFATDTASGAVANFPDGADNIPMKDVLVHIEPVQEGSGDQSPENVRPITGWTGAKVTRTGKNLLSVNTIEDVSWAYDLITTQIAKHNISKIINSLNVGTYTISYTATVTSVDTQKYTSTTAKAGIGNMTIITSNGDRFINDRVEINLEQALNHYSITNDLTFNVTANNKGKFTHCYIYGIGRDAATEGAPNGALGHADITNIQLELGSTVTSYEPYTGQTYDITFPSEAGTVYGGTLDVTKGELVVDRAIWIGNTADMNNSEDYPGWKSARILDIVGRGINAGVYSVITNISPAIASGPAAIAINTASFPNIGVLWLNKNYFNKNQTEWKALALDIQIVLPLATPITYTLTPQEITSLLGENNVWADTGDVSVEYRADTKLYIEKLTQPEEYDMIADSAISEGQFFMVGNSLYRALANIASGATITVGTNAQRVSLSDALNLVNA